MKKLSLFFFSFITLLLVSCSVESSEEAMKIVSKKESKSIKKVEAVECRISIPYPFGLSVQYTGRTFGSGKYDLYWDNNELSSSFSNTITTMISIVDIAGNEIYNSPTANDGYERIELPYTGEVNIQVHFDCHCGAGCGSYDEVNMYLFYMNGGLGSLLPN